MLQKMVQKYSIEIRRQAKEQQFQRNRQNQIKSQDSFINEFEYMTLYFQKQCLLNGLVSQILIIDNEKYKSILINNLCQYQEDKQYQSMQLQMLPYLNNCVKELNIDIIDETINSYYNILQIDNVDLDFNLIQDFVGFLHLQIQDINIFEIIFILHHFLQKKRVDIVDNQLIDDIIYYSKTIYFQPFIVLFTNQCNLVNSKLFFQRLDFIEMLINMIEQEQTRKKIQILYFCKQLLSNVETLNETQKLMKAINSITDFPDTIVRELVFQIQQIYEMKEGCSIQIMSSY